MEDSVDNKCLIFYPANDRLVLEQKRLERIKGGLAMDSEERDVLEAQLEDCRFALSKVSHEIRNPVTLINSNLQLMEKQYPQLKQCDLWQDIMEDMAFLRYLLDDLSSFNNALRCSLKETRPSQWLRELARSIPKLFPEKERYYQTDIPTDLPCVKIDKLKLNQALTNLLRNAFEAAESQILFRAFIRDGRLCMEVHNDGSWIPDKVRKDIFCPFFTTKAEGTGLGLPIADGIIKMHKGMLSVTSSETAGTSFLVSLPLC